MKFDVIIIGGGAAGISAALWCDELKLKTLLLESRSELGGQLMRVYNPIKNHLGIKTENGLEMRDIFVKQIENCEFKVQLNSEITKVDLNRRIVTLKTGEEFFGKAIIIASGVRRRKLDVEGETEFVGRGILESGKRDAALVKNKTVAIVGGGDAAFENALILSETAERVLLINRSQNFRARPQFVEPAKNNGKIKICTETVVKRIIGDKIVKAFELKDLRTGEIYKEKIGAILLRLGVEPNTDFLSKELIFDKHGYIETNQFCETVKAGIYAVGDVANPIAPTVSSAVGMGATAAKAIFARLRNL